MGFIFYYLEALSVSLLYTLQNNAENSDTNLIITSKFNTIEKGSIMTVDVTIAGIQPDMRFQNGLPPPHMKTREFWVDEKTLISLAGSC